MALVLSDAYGHAESLVVLGADGALLTRRRLCRAEEAADAPDDLSDLDLSGDQRADGREHPAEAKLLATGCRCGGRLTERDEDGRTVCMHCRRTVRTT